MRPAAAGRAAVMLPCPALALGGRRPRNRARPQRRWSVSAMDANKARIAAVCIGSGRGNGCAEHREGQATRS